MKPGTFLIILILLAYFGFEIFAISRVSYRMEPMYIFERFVAADRAMTRCGQPGSAMRSNFARNRASVRQRAKRELLKQNPAETAETIDRQLSEVIQSQETEVNALIDKLGCDDIEIFKLIKGYENRARLNLPAPAGANGG